MAILFILSCIIVGFYIVKSFFYLEIYLFKHHPKIARFFWRDTKGPMRFRN